MKKKKKHGREPLTPIRNCGGYGHYWNAEVDPQLSAPLNDTWSGRD